MRIPLTPGNIRTTDLDSTDPIPQGFTLVDVRRDEEWEAGHAPGALHIPLTELANRIDDLPDEDIIVTCRSGGRSAQATALLADLGIEVWNLADGMLGWAAGGLPLTSDDGDIPTIL
ncbi:MAG: rhodanese-like domain-containing protein [Flaviflexus sp.]|nr:rhodanese-like domain-containing protein [Flaviflexus sp.]